MKLLVVVDMQNDFIDGALGTKEAQAIVPRVRKKIEGYRKNGDAVIFTRDTHGEDYLDTQEGCKLPVEHCIKGTEGWMISSEFETGESIIIDKPTFGSYELIEKTAEINKRTPLEYIELVGVCTDICVISNAIILKAGFTEIPVKVDASCCAGVTPETHDTALRAMSMCQIEITEEDE